MTNSVSNPINMDHCETIHEMVNIAIAETWRSKMLGLYFEYEGVVIQVWRTSEPFDVLEKYSLRKEVQFLYGSLYGK